MTEHKLMRVEEKSPCVPAYGQVTTKYQNIQYDVCENIKSYVNNEKTETVMTATNQHQNNVRSDANETGTVITENDNTISDHVAEQNIQAVLL